MPLRIAVLISGGGSTLANLIRRIDDGRLRDVTIGLVVSSGSAVPGVGIARDAGLALKIVRTKDSRTGPSFSARITELVDEADVSLVVLAGFLHLWRFPARYAGRVLNIHPALLPAFGGRGMFGRRVHEAVLAAGAGESGCTVHIANLEYDQGPIVARARVALRPDDTVATLAERVQAAERELYPEVIQRVAEHGLEWLRERGAAGDDA